MYCRYCGHEMNNNKCINLNCKTNINTSKINLYENDIIAFIGPNSTSYYMEKCRRYQYDPLFLSWNWICFLCPSIWFASRKMYTNSIITFVILLLSVLFTPNYISLIVFTMSVFSALIANRTYIRFVVDKLFTLKEKTSPIDLKYINSIGGVNYISIFVASIFLISIILLYVFTH